MSAQRENRVVVEGRRIHVRADDFPRAVIIHWAHRHDPGCVDDVVQVGSIQDRAVECGLQHNAGRQENHTTAKVPVDDPVNDTLTTEVSMISKAISLEMSYTNSDRPPAMARDVARLAVILKA